MRMCPWLIGKQENASRSHIVVVKIIDTLVEGREVILQGNGIPTQCQSQNAIANIGRVIGSVRHACKDVSSRVRGDTGAGHPDPAPGLVIWAHAIGSREVHGGLCKRRSIISK